MNKKTKVIMVTIAILTIAIMLYFTKAEINHGNGLDNNPPIISQTEANAGKEK